MNTKVLLGLIVFLLVLFGLSNALFVVHASEHAVLLRFGEVVDSDLKPGLHVLLPLVDDVRKFDARTQVSDAESTPLQTSDKNYLVLSTYIVWQVSTGGSTHDTDARLLPLVREALKDSLSGHDLHDIVVAGQEPSMASLLPVLAAPAAELGISIRDVGVRRIEYASAEQDAVYQRMSTTFKARADSIRAGAAAEADQVVAVAQENRRLIEADGSRQAEQLRGQGDGQAAAITAQVAGSDPEFYRFFRSMEVYRAGFNKPQDVLILRADDELLKYLKSPGK